MSRLLFFGVALVQAVLCMQVTQSMKSEVFVLTRPNQITDQFTVLASDESSIRSFVDAINFEKLQDMDVLFMKVPEVPVEASQEGLSISFPMTRSTAKSSILENYESLLKIGSGNKIRNLVAGFQMSCHSETSPNCLFSIHLRSKTMGPSAAKSIINAFPVLGSKVQTQKKSFFDNISPKVWDDSAALLDNGQKCSWKFATGNFSVCFNEHSLASVMEFVRYDAVSSFEFKHCSNRTGSKKIQLEVSPDAKNKLPVLMTSLSLRSGQSLGFDQMSSFEFDCAGDKCSLKISHDGDLNVNGLQNVLEMNKIISDSCCVPAIDDSAWVFYRRNSMLLASFFFLESNADQLKRVLNDLNITLWKTKTTQENSKTFNTLRALGDPYYTVSFEVEKIDSKLVTLMHLLNSELLSSTTGGCSFFRRLIKISINRQADTGIVQFAFSSATEIQDLKVASKFLELLCKIVDDQVVGPNAFKVADKQSIIELNLAMIAEEKMQSSRDFKADELRKKDEAAKFAAEKERQQKLHEETLLKQQKAEAARKEQDRQRELQRQQAEARKEEQRKIAEAKKQEQLKREQARLEQRKAEEVRRAEIAKQDREKAEQRRIEQAKKVEEQRIREAEQLKLKEEARIAEELKKAELEKQRKAEEEAKQAELEKRRKAEEARKRKEAEKRRQEELERLEEENRKHEAERKAEEQRIAEERRLAQEQKKAEAEAKAQARKIREAAVKKQVQQKKSQFKLSDVQDVQREITPVIRKKLATVKDRKRIITACEAPAKSAMSMTMEPIPQSSVLQVLDMEYWLAAHPDFIKTWGSPKASPFIHFKEDFEFWVHQGEMDEKVNPEKFIRVFKAYQSITCLESLYYNYNNAVIDVLAELPGKNHLGLFKKAFSPKTPSARTAIRLSLDAGDQAVALLNVFWQITIMLLIQHDAEWYPHLRGVLVEPSDSKTFQLEAWWDPSISAKLTHSFEDAFLAEARKIAQIPDEAAEWEILC